MTRTPAEAIRNDEEGSNMTFQFHEMVKFYAVWNHALTDEETERLFAAGGDPRVVPEGLTQALLPPVGEPWPIEGDLRSQP